MYSDNLNHIHRMTDMGLYKVVKLKRGETPLGNKRKFIEALNSNPWLFADIHVSANIEQHTMQKLTQLGYHISDIIKGDRPFDPDTRKISW